MWTHFWDMHSGGGLKEECANIFIEAPEEEAKIIFYNRFGHNPERVSCTCCGNDYSISEGEDLAQLTGYHRGCQYNKSTHKYLEDSSEETYRDKYQTLGQYLKSDGVMVIYAKDVKPEELSGDIPDQGYIWVD